METDILIIGAGIAGTSLAYFLAPHMAVHVLEAEMQPGYHSTGRSAAFYAETYGGAAIQPLTTASKAFFHVPPPEFSDAALVSARGALHVTASQKLSALDDLLDTFVRTDVRIEALDSAATLGLAPMLRDDWALRGLWEPDCKDIDVAALHQGFMRGAKRAGCRFESNQRVRALHRDGGRWRAITSGGEFRADIVVNAAGAWADDVAALAGARPLGVTPYRRTVIAADVGAPPKANLPLIIDASGELYFKSEAGQMWISPHDETRSPPCDVQPEEIDVALAVDRFQNATTQVVRRVTRRWAGLRSFAPDRRPIYGFDPQCAGFFWCAGQGGFGIQTAPAAGRLAAALINDAVAFPEHVDAEFYTPGRF